MKRSEKALAGGQLDLLGENADHAAASQKDIMAPERGPFFNPAVFAGNEGSADRCRFRQIIYNYYKENGRSFPWRDTKDPWRILVSEIMLQQTQTERVIPKYEAFIRRFPSPEELAEASVAELLPLWSGLGYNRRALALKRAAGQIVTLYSGKLPADAEKLDALDGVGPYTARAVMAFAFGSASAFIETNIRSVFIYHFFPQSALVSDKEIEPLVEASLDRADPRNWYYALMDYGVALKRRIGNPARRSSSYSKQSSFADSHRRIRGAVLRALSEAYDSEGGTNAAVGHRAENNASQRDLSAADNTRAYGLEPDAAAGNNKGQRQGKQAVSHVSLDREELARKLPFARERIEKAIDELIAEGFIEERKGSITLAGQNERKDRDGGKKP